MKDKFLKMAGVNSEEEFYSMFPTEEAFFQAYPEAREMKKGGNVPTNPELYSRVKSEAKSKFDRWPSAYGSAWLVKTYKSRGGGYRKAQTGGGLQDQQIFQYPNYDQNMLAYMQKAQQDQQNNPIGAIGDMFINGAMAVGQSADNGSSKAMDAAKLAGAFLQMGGVGTMMRDTQYDEGGEMAIGQIMAMHDKLSRLQKFVNGETEIDPWVASKLTLADDYLNTVADYMQYNEGNEVEEEEDNDMNMGEMEEMKMGGIPQRYKNRGFTKVGVKRKSDRAGKKWMVLAKKGDKYKIVHGGYTGMKDFSQHHSEKRKDNFWNRMGGKDSAKAHDPFSPLYWHKRFGTWAEGGQPEEGGPVKQIPFKEIAEVENKKAKNKKALDIGEIAASIAGSIGMIAADARLTRGKNKYRDEHLGGGYPDPTMRQKWDLGKRAKGGEPQNAGFQALPDYVQNKIMANMAYGGDMYGGQMDMDAMYNMMKGGNIYQQGGEGMSQNDGEEKVMQAIQMYAEMTQTDPQQIYNQLKNMSPQEQQQAIQQIMQAIQQQQAQSPDTMAYGGIHINPANKGKFTASANRAGMGVQEFARHVLANKEDYSSTQVKRANFARNAAKWKKQMGGMTEGSELELHPDEIQALIDQGYGIEYLD